MNLEKVALYLEYIAFDLRRSAAQPQGDSMAKQKQPQADPDAGQPPAYYDGPADQFEAAASDPTGPAEPPQAQTGVSATPRQERTTTRGLSGELVAMGKIDRVMQELPERTAELVRRWFLHKFFPDPPKPDFMPLMGKISEAQRAAFFEDGRK